MDFIQKNIINCLFKLASMGAICLMLTQVVSQKALPFSLKAPNQTTIDTFNATDSGADIVKCKDANDTFAKLGI